MARVNRFRRAEEDLLTIADYIAAENPTAAAKWLDRIEATLSLLASNPLMGESVGSIRPGLRQFTQGSYVVFYEPSEKGIDLVRVLHGSRRIEELLG